MLADPPHGVRVAASSSHEMGLLELFEIQYDEGPCLDCYRTGVPVHCPDLGTARELWPTFAPEALRSGFASVHALPMRLRSDVIGSLNLLRNEAGTLHDEDLVAAQALADVATIGILHHRAADEYQLVADQLQYALNSRVIIEQAKGVIAEHADVDMDAAFTALRTYAHDHNQRLVEVAEAIAQRQLSAETLAPQPTLSSPNLRAAIPRSVP